MHKELTGDTEESGQENGPLKMCLRTSRTSSKLREQLAGKVCFPLSRESTRHYSIGPPQYTCNRRKTPGRFDRRLGTNEMKMS